MTGAHLPEDDHVARYCPFRRRDPETGRPNAVAFFLDEDEESLSVNWVEYLHRGPRDEQVIALRKEVRQVLSLKRSATFAILNVGKLKEKVADASGRKLSVLHDPVPPTESHSGIAGMRPNARMIARYVADAVDDCWPAVEPHNAP